MGLRAEATLKNDSQLTSFSASSTHSEIKTVSVVSDSELKETQGAFWLIVFWAVQIAVASYSTGIIIGPGSFPCYAKPAY